MISVAIASLPEEEDKLKDCISSVKNFADEVVVIKIGKDVPFTSYVETIRNKMIEKCKGDWVLILDPDERISESLSNKLKEIAKDGVYDAVNIPRKNIIFGKWISHSNWWPDKHVRFFKKGTVSWSATIHKYPDVKGKVITLPAQENLAILHIGYLSISEFIDKQNRYSDIEAENRIKNGEHFSWFKFFWWPKREFLARYIKHLGFLDGMRGFVLVFLMMFFKIVVMIKMWEKNK